MHTEESGPPRLIVPRRRRLAEIPSGNPLKHILERELLGRVAHRKRHGRHAVTVDYFCGAGGLTTGVERARERLRMPGYHYGINHDERAIQTIRSIQSTFWEHDTASHWATTRVGSTAR